MSVVSVRKIILNDFLAFLLAIGGPVALGLSAFTAAFGFMPNPRKAEALAVGSQLAFYMCAVALALTAILFFLLVRRISRIKSIMTTGVRAKATVRDIGFFKDRGRVEYEYTHVGQKYLRGTAIMKNKETKSIQFGDEIEVAFDPTRPHGAFVVRLYTT